MEQLPLFGTSIDVPVFKVMYCDTDSSGRQRLHSKDISSKDVESALKFFRNSRTILSIKKI